MVFLGVSNAVDLILTQTSIFFNSCFHLRNVGCFDLFYDNLVKTEASFEISFCVWITAKAFADLYRFESSTPFAGSLA